MRAVSRGMAASKPELQIAGVGLMPEGGWLPGGVADVLLCHAVLCRAVLGPGGGC